jgi:hypothetical protein
MNIKEFKSGDIITRNEPVRYEHSGSRDSSYCGERFIFKGNDPVSKIIFIEGTDSVFNGDILDLSYARENWDEGWCYYPETLFQKIKKAILPKKSKDEGIGNTDPIQ